MQAGGAQTQCALSRCRTPWRPPYPHVRERGWGVRAREGDARGAEGSRGTSGLHGQTRSDTEFQSWAVRCIVRCSGKSGALLRINRSIPVSCSRRNPLIAPSHNQTRTVFSGTSVREHGHDGNRDDVGGVPSGVRGGVRGGVPNTARSTTGRRESGVAYCSFALSLHLFKGMPSR